MSHVNKAGWMIPLILIFVLLMGGGADPILMIMLALLLLAIAYLARNSLHGDSFGNFIWERQRQNQINLARGIIIKYARELCVRKAQKIVDKGYGIRDSGKWIEDVNMFISQKIIPLTGAVSPQIEALFRRMIEEVTANYDKLTPEFHEAMSGQEYERMVASILARQGWFTRLTPATGDAGVDVIAEKSGVKAVIQCKRYSTPVGISAIQEIHTARAIERADHAVVVSNIRYTKAAKQAAVAAGVLLLHHDELPDLWQECMSHPLH
jgi:restriction system protein